MNKLDENKIRELFSPILFLCVGYVIVVSYIFLYHDKIITSDNAADLILANLLNKEGALWTKNFFYSTEIILFDTQFVFKPALLLFPGDWTAARLFASATMLLICFISMLFFVRSLKIGPRGLWAVAFCAFPIGARYVITVSYGAFYIPHLVFSFVVLAIFFYSLKVDKNKFLCISVIGFVISMLSGMRSIRTLMQLNIPLFLTALVLFLIERYGLWGKVKFLSRERRYGKKALVSASVMLISSVIGYGFNVLWLSGHFYYTDYNTSTWSFFSLTKMISCVSDYIGSFGYHEGTEILSVAGISSLFGLLIGIAVFLAMLLLLFKFSDILTDEEYFMVLYTFILFCLCVFIFAHNDVYFYQYWVPVMPFGYIVLAIAIKYIYLKKPNLNKLKYDILIGLIPFFACIGWLLMPFTTSDDSWSLLPVAYWLNDNMEYTKGIATFWNSDIITELSDGRIEMWTVDGFEEMNCYTFLQETSHWNLPEDDVFVIMSYDEYALAEQNLLDEYVVFDSGEYKVLVFNSGNEGREIILSAVSKE